MTRTRPRLGLLAAPLLLVAACARPWGPPASMTDPATAPPAAEQPASARADGAAAPVAIAASEVAAPPRPEDAAAGPESGAGRPAHEWRAEMPNPIASDAGRAAADTTPTGPSVGATPITTSPETPATGAGAASPPSAVEPCNLPPPQPFVPGGAGRPSSWSQPLPPAPLWDPPGPRRVGLQAGHWLTEQVPAELGRLQHGAEGGGKQEWEVNLDLARRAKAILEAAGLQVDLLPTTVPQRYRAHAFVSIHADGDPAGRSRGFKVARPGFSSIPEHDDRLVAALNEAYGAATALPRDDGNITIRMRYYYAFNSRRYCHAVAPGVPQAIVETGFLTSASDRALLLGSPDRAARGIANGVLAFLNGNPRP